MLNFRYSRNGLALTKRFEADDGPALAAYWDKLGFVWTIGYGHTGTDVYEGLTCTTEQAEQWLLEDIAWAEKVVNTHVTYSINQNEFDALVDFVFNVGCENFEKSTLFKLLNAGNLHAAAEQFQLWDKSGGKVVAGLLRRRLDEETLFNTSV